MTRAILLPFAAMLGLCASLTLAQAPTSKAPAAVATPPGQQLFRARCGGCHLDRGFGTRVLSRRVDAGKALLEQRDDLTADYVRSVVRQGLGSMPVLRAEELDDARLGEISKYLAKGK